MTWLLIFCDLWELEEVHVSWNVSAFKDAGYNVKAEFCEGSYCGFSVGIWPPPFRHPDPKENIAS